MNYPLIGQGWTETQTLNTKECLVVRDLDTISHRFFWRCIELQSGKSFPLVGAREPASPEVLYCLQSQELIFADQVARSNRKGKPVDSKGGRERPQSGLWSYHLQMRTEKLLCNLDTDNYEVIPIWATPDSETIYFLQKKRRVSISESIKQGPKQIRKDSNSQELRLFGLIRSSGTMKAVTDVFHGIASFDIDSRSNSFFATTIDQDFNTTLIRIDLATSTSAVIGRFPKRVVSLDTGTEMKIESWPEYRHVSVTQQGEILLTGNLGSGISRFIPPDIEEEVVKIGHAPSYSPDGTRLAFLRRVNNGLWLKNGVGEPTSIYCFSRSGISRKPAWCPCGNHIVASLISTEGEQRGITIVADTRSKELLTIQHSQHPYIPNGYVWIQETPRQ